jgi:Domain of unknown function (DUF6894)
MAQVYFRCSNPRQLLMDRSGADVGDLTEAHESAARVVRSLVTAPSLEDWRQWSLHASDDLGDEIFVIPFTSILGKPH